MPLNEEITDTVTETDTLQRQETVNDTRNFLLSDNFQETLIKEEAVAAFGARNKIRESILIAMNKDITRGGDGLRYQKPLEMLRQDANASMQELADLLSKIR